MTRRVVIITSRWLVVVAYMYCIYVLSSRPLAFPIPELGIPILGVDKILHMIAYGLLAFFLCRAMAATVSGPLDMKLLFVVVVITMVYGALDEIHQARVPMRQSSAADLVADAVGAVFVTALWPTVSARWPIITR